MIKKKIMAAVMAVVMTASMIQVSGTVETTSAATTWRSSLYPENWTPGYTNSAGQFLHDFSYAGYEKGEKDIPTSMTGLYANVLDYGADSTGTNDSTSAIQSAINAVQNAGGGTVYLPAGTYKVKPASSSNASALRITGSNILFKGDGVGKTFIRCFAENMRYCQVINVSPNGGTWDSADDGNYYYLSQDIPSTPTTTIHLSSVGNLKVGDWVIIRSDRTQGWIDEHSMGGFWYASVSPTTHGTTFYRQITAVNTTNKTIEIDIPTRYYMKTRDNARVYKVTPKQSNVGLQDFSIGNKQNSITSGWGEEDYKTSGNGSYNVNNAFLIKFGLNVNCFAKNIKTYAAGNAGGYHMVSNGLDINKTRGLTVDNCDFSYPQYEGGGGNGYGMNICGQETLIKNCSSTSARHSFSFKYAYASGNVIYHYTSTDPKYGSDFHMYLSMSNLIDNEELNGDFLETNVRPYGGTAGNRHGYTSTQTVFWNTKGNYYKSGSSYIIDSRQYGYGYIIGTQGAATAVKTTPTTMSSTYGTVNTAPEDFKEGIGTGASLSPQSLYYDQLERRLRGNSTEEPTTENTSYVAKNVPGTFNATDYYSATSEIVKNTSAAGTKYVGQLASGSTLEYKVNVEKSGYYNINIKSVSGNSNSTRTLTLYSDNEELAKLTGINATDWEDFKDLKGRVYLASGTHMFKMVSSGSINIADITFTRSENSPIEVPTISTTSSNKRVVGYLPSYRNYTIDSIDYSALTHLCLAFMTYSNGTCTSGFSASDVKKIVQKCHDNNVKVLIALGGGGGFNTSDGPLNTAEKRTSIINQVMNYVNTYNLDGVDIDIEVTDSNVWKNFEAFCSEFSSRLKAGNKLFTMAVSSWFTDPIPNKAYTYFDFVNLMTYDAAFGNGDVAPWSQIYNMISYYRNRGISDDRMVIGVPFYGYGSGGTAYTYAEILAMNSANSSSDYYNGIYYNGANTIKSKAEYSKDFGGTMIWELGQDVFDSRSLLQVIKGVMQSGNQTTTSATVTNVPGNVLVNSFGSKTSTITMTTENGVTYAGGLTNGASLDYYINVPESGKYTFKFHFAAGDTQYNADNMVFKVNDNEISKMPLQLSASWTTFDEYTAEFNFVTAGNYKVSIMSDGGACNVTDFTVSKSGEQTTTPEEPTSQEEVTTPEVTTKVPEGVEQPTEVFGVVVSSNADNTISVVWGRDTEMEAKGQLHNVYLDGVKVYDNVICGSYDMINVPAGTHTVRVTSVYNGYETTGYSEAITVTGKAASELETTEEPTTEEVTTKVENKVQMEINGYQISATVEGFRVIYSVSDVANQVEAVGMVYGLESDSTEEDMVVGSNNAYVFNYDATDEGKMSTTLSKMEAATSYTMTMKFIDTTEFYNAGIRVRAYAKLKDGSYVYSNVKTCSVYDISDILYQNRKMSNINNHKYLFNKILSKVNPMYKEVEYDWGNTIVKID